MSADTIAFVLVLLAAIPATGFPLVYGVTSPWHRSRVGRALMTKACGLMLLIDISLVYMIFGDDYPWRDVVRLTVYVFVTVGLWYQFYALLRAKFLDQPRYDR